MKFWQSKNSFKVILIFNNISLEKELSGLGPGAQRGEGGAGSVKHISYDGELKHIKQGHSYVYRRGGGVHRGVGGEVQCHMVRLGPA